MQKKKHVTLEEDRLRISYREGFIEDEQIFENHCHARYELIAVFEGAVDIVVEHRRYNLKAGEIAFIPPLCYHSVFGGGDIVYKRATVLFDKEVIPCEIFDDFLLKTARQPISAHDSLLPTLATLKEIFSDDNGNISKFFPLAISLITEIMYTHTYKTTEEKREISHPTVKAITEYIDAHIGEKILTDDVAGALFLSRSTVSHIFKEEMKISLKQYILQKKLGFSAGLIESGASALEASEAIGYDNYANFYKMYKKVMGVSPKGK